MDKTTKGFVIAACSVVIAVPVVWIGSQLRCPYLKHVAWYLPGPLSSKTDTDWLDSCPVDWNNVNADLHQ